MTSVNTHLIRGLRNVSVMFSELVKYKLPLIRIGCRFERREPKTGRRLFVTESEFRQIGGGDLLFRVHDDNAFDGVLKFTHVAGPGVILETLERIRLESLRLLAVIEREALIKVFQ